MSLLSRPLSAVVSKLRRASGRGGARGSHGRGAPVLGLVARWSLLGVAAAGCALVLGAASAPAKVVNSGSGTRPGLPDGRAYEQVTPANKDNGDPYLRAGIFAEDQVAANGNRVSYFSLYAFPGSKFYGLSYLATREKHSWVSQNETPPQSTDTGFLCAAFTDMVGYSADMARGILVDGANQPACGTDDPNLVPGEPQGVQNVFLRNNNTGNFKLISLNPVSGPPADARYDGGSSDLSHVVFDESAQLTSNAPSGDDNLYEWTGGAVSLVTLVPSSGKSCTGGACTPTVGSLAGGAMGNVMHAVSSDGSRIYFTANGDLYLRQNGTSTRQIDAPAQGAPGPGGGGQFAAASADGSKVFFTDADSAGLTKNTVPGSGTNLYEYDVASHTLTDLTPTKGAEVQGFSGSSADGSYVYYVADGKLAPGAAAGQPNLYVRHHGTKFIATLNASDSNDWSSGSLTARVPSNGKFIGFNSINSLTGYNNEDITTKQPDDEIFLYEAASGKLVCASCNPSGRRPTGSASIPGPEESGANSVIDILQRSVSESGQVFFQSPDALVPTDTNGHLDVYEYELDGSGSCTQATNCTYLISGGTSDADSLFFDASPNGSNVLFVTVQQLVPQDTDGAYDIYDARVNGGFPAPQPPPPPCQGESCKPPPKPPPPLPTVATVTFTGPGGASAKAIKRAVAGPAFRVAVAVPRKGRITIAGAGIETARDSATKAGRYKVRVTLTRKEKRQLALWGRLKLTIRVRYAPAAGRAATATFKLTVKA